MGSKPFFFHEVIDQGGEPIHTSEYFHLGKVTEFRSCTWVACIQNGDLNCLQNFGSVRIAFWALEVIQTIRINEIIIDRKAMKLLMFDFCKS